MTLKNRTQGQRSNKDNKIDEAEAEAEDIVKDYKSFNLPAGVSASVSSQVNKLVSFWSFP